MRKIALTSEQRPPRKALTNFPELVDLLSAKPLWTYDGTAMEQFGKAFR
jgi:hypothetical protein